MLATVYGFLFGGLVDWLGELHMNTATMRPVLVACFLAKADCNDSSAAASASTTQQILCPRSHQLWLGTWSSSPCPPAGVRTSLVVCFVLHTACRLAMAVTTSRHVMLAVLLGPETMAGALGVPVLTIGIKRFTTQARPWSVARSVTRSGRRRVQRLAGRRIRKTVHVAMCDGLDDGLGPFACQTT